MNSYRTLAYCVGALLVLSPLAAATHEKENGPPDSTFGWIGGANLAPMINVAPQEIDLLGNIGDEDVPTGKQRLKTAGSYDCATGVPAVGPNAGRFVIDAVPMNVITNLLNPVGLNDHIYDGQLNAIDARLDSLPTGDPTGTDFGDNSSSTNYVYYGTVAYVGYGSGRTTAVMPGIVTFFAYVLCVTETAVIPAKVLPAVSGKQTPGFFGFLDENEYTPVAGASNPYSPEMAFYYAEPETDETGILLPGDTLTPGWYLDSWLIWTPDQDLKTNTFRFVVNPSLVAEYPGYTGSLFEGPARRCLVNGEAGPEGGTFGNCDNSGPGFRDVLWIPSHHFYPETALETPDFPAPTLEDIEAIGAVDANLLGGESTIEPVVMEAFALQNEADRQRVENTPQTSRSREVEPTLPGEESPVAALSGGWSVYFDVRKYQTTGANTVDPLYDLGATDKRDIYPGFHNYRAILGLWKDFNGDGIVDADTAGEWFPLDDRLVAQNGTFLANWADVGSLEEGGNDLVGTDSIVVVDQCTQVPVVTAYDPGDRVPIGSTNIAGCNALGNSTEAWGAFRGGTSAAGSGEYTISTDFLTVSGSTSGEWRTSVKARFVVPPFDVFKLSGLTAPVDLSLYAGQTFLLTDVDAYGPTL